MNSKTSPFRTLVEAQQDLMKKGFIANFQFKDGKMLDMENRKAYQPQNLKIEHYYRFEGISNPADSSIIYALETHDGRKGLFVSAYGPYSNSDIDEFIKKIEIDS